MYSIYSKNQIKGGLSMIKTFVLDTNILLHSAGALDSFADNEIILPKNTKMVF